MCLALPARVVAIDQATDMAVVELDGIRKEVSLALVEDVAENDFVLIHVGYALNKVSEEEARLTLELFAQAGLTGDAVMKYVNEFRQQSLARRLSAAIAAEVEPDRQYNLMEFCGGHTHAIFRYGVQDLMPDNVSFVHGPGCPVCVLPIGRIDNAIHLVEAQDVILCTYGDLLRVPASGRKSLLKVKAAGADVRMVYSTQDALRIARENPQRQVVFFAIGFETTTPPTAVAIKQAQAEGLENFSVFCNHVLTPAAIQNILESPEVRELGTVSIDGFFGPSHVSSIIGSQPYEFFAEEYQKPVVIAGFEPLDVMQSALMLVRQINSGRHEVENEYTRVVTREGNLKAQNLVAEVLELRRSFEWRGLGLVPYSALKIKQTYAGLRCRAALRDSRLEGGRRQGVRMPGHSARRQTPHRLQTLRHASARRRIRWAPAWSRPRAPAPPTGVTAVFAIPMHPQTPLPDLLSICFTRSLVVTTNAKKISVTTEYQAGQWWT